MSSSRRVSATPPAAVALVLAVALLAGCGSGGGSAAEPARGDAPLAVVAAFYPLEEMTRNVGGDRVAVTELTPAGRSPHDLQLTPRQVEAVQEADVVVYLGRGFQPQVEDAVEGAPATTARVDLLATVPLLPVDAPLAGIDGEVDGEVLEGGVDPHVWLDPIRMVTMVGAVTDALASADPGGAAVYRANADRYLAGLQGLDGEYRTALTTCRSRALVTSHRAFGYLADRYGLEQLPIAGVSPDDEPDPKALEAIAAVARARGVTTIYLETIAPPDLARTVADEVGARLDLLDPIEGLTADDLAAGTTYASIMRENLARLASGLGCSS